MIRSLALSGLVVFVTFSAGAQTTLHYREGQRVEPQDVRQILNNVEGNASRARSIRVLNDEPASVAVVAAAATPNSLSLPIHFDLDSVTISASAREQLDALAEGIKLLPAGRRVVIEGHTDARGTDDYNQSLSMRRAAAVKQYLVTHGIEAQRLRDTGLGKRQPIAGADPFAAENRRVQFRGS